jgi:hypothetical protein
MRRTLIAVSAAAALGAASLAAPTPAQAHAWWVVPAIVGGVIVGGAAVAAASSPYAPGYGPGPAHYRGTVMVEPSCRIVRERVAGGWRRVQVCN